MITCTCTPRLYWNAAHSVGGGSCSGRIIPHDNMHMHSEALLECSSFRGGGSCSGRIIPHDNMHMHSEALLECSSFRGGGGGGELDKLGGPVFSMTKKQQRLYVSQPLHACITDDEGQLALNLLQLL